MLKEAFHPEILIGVNSLFLFATAILGYLSYRQREAIRKRDNYQCQHPDKSITHGGRLEVDHLLPQRWGYNHLGLSEEQIDSPINLITECQNHHRGHPKSRHPDAHVAWITFHEDKEAFVRMEKARNDKLVKGEKYWNSTHDEELLQIARINTEKAIQKGWRWPFKKNQNGNGKR